MASLTFRLMGYAFQTTLGMLSRTLFFIDALRHLRDRVNSRGDCPHEVFQNYKAIDLIAEAYARTWGDVHAWIHINKSDNSKKKKKNTKNKEK